MEGAWVERVVVGVLATVVLALAVGVPAASAEPLSPWWGLTSGSQPTNLVTGATGEIVVTAENRGDASTSGEVTVSDQLPAGLEAIGIKGVAGETSGSGNRGPVSCVKQTLTCTFGTVETTNAKGEKVPEALRPYEEIEVRHLRGGARRVQRRAEHGERVRWRRSERGERGQSDRSGRR